MGFLNQRLDAVYRRSGAISAIPRLGPQRERAAAAPHYSPTRRL